MNADNDILPDVEEEEEDAMDCESDSDSLDSTSERSDYPCPFCNTDFINQEEVFEHMEICSGTDPEPDWGAEADLSLLLENIWQIS